MAALERHVQWAASVDLDEYLAPSTAVGFFEPKWTRAERIFDRSNWRRRNAIKFTWLNFRVASMDLSRNLSQKVLSHKLPKLRDPHKANARCYDVPRNDKNGKSALKCDYGLGFTVHYAVQASRSWRMDQWTRRTPVTTRNVRTWHPRLKGSMSKCEFLPD